MDKLWESLPDIIEYEDFDCYDNIVPIYAHKHVIFGDIAYIQIVDKNDLMTEDWDNHFPLFEDEEESSTKTMPLSKRIELAKEKLEILKRKGLIRF